MIRQNDVEIKISRYIGVWKLPEDTQSDIISRIATACKKRGIASPLIDMRMPISEQVVIIKGKEISFSEIHLNDDERVVKEICDAILDMQYPCYRGDLIMPIGNESFIFKDFVVMMVPSPPGMPKGGGIHITRYFIDEQCNIVFPTANFKSNSDKPWFKDLNLPIPMTYQNLGVQMQAQIDTLYGSTEAAGAQDYARKELAFLARASKIYPVNMIWADGVIPHPVREMMPIIPCNNDNALKYMEMADVDRIGMLDHLGQLNEQGIIQQSNDAAPANIVDAIGDAMQGQNDTRSRALLAIEREIASSKYGGNNVEVHQVSEDSVTFRIQRPRPRPGPDPAPGTRTQDHQENENNPRERARRAAERAQQ